MAAKPNIVARCLVGALVCVAPAMLGAGAPDRTQWKDGGPVRAEAARGWDGKVQGWQLVTPVELRFDDPRDLEAFAAGQLPIGLTLRSAASGQTVRLAPALVREGFRPGGAAASLTLYVVIDNLLAPVWDAGGCTETGVDAGNGADDSGVEIALTYAACGAEAAAERPGRTKFKNIVLRAAAGGPTGAGAGGAAMRTAGQPVTGIIVKGGRNPGGNLLVAPGPSEAGAGAEVRLRARLAGAAQNLVIAVSSKGAGSPKANGF